MFHNSDKYLRLEMFVLHIISSPKREMGHINSKHEQQGTMTENMWNVEPAPGIHAPSDKLSSSLPSSPMPKPSLNVGEDTNLLLILLIVSSSPTVLDSVSLSISAMILLLRASKSLVVFVFAFVVLPPSLLPRVGEAARELGTAGSAQR